MFSGPCSSIQMSRFRPLSGYLISKYFKRRICWKLARQFPSPLGVSYFQIKNRRTTIWATRVSVPSRGILFPNKMEALDLKIKYVIFRPLSGYLISKLRNKPTCDLPLTGFRPLSGYLISKWWHKVLSNRYNGCLFPSPLGVSYFQIQFHLYCDKPL